MKTSNYLVLIASAIIAGVLLFLWFNLGFSKVDNPIDITLAIAWWVLIVVIVAVIVCFENRRKRQIRTIYVSDGALFNSECGVTKLDGSSRATLDAMQTILRKLKYGFTSADMPNQDEFRCRYIVRTDEYKAADGEPKWKGSVTRIGNEGDTTDVPFSSQAELGRALGL